MLDYIKNYISYGVFGNKVRMESSSICQLRCPECPQAGGDLGEIGQGFLKIGNFKRFVDKYATFKKIELSNYGEPFLNPDLKKIIKYADKRGIEITLENGSNLNSVSDEVLEALVKYKVRSLYVSLDGATQKTYSKYRVGGDFDRVIENIRRINYYKKKYESSFPRLSWQFIVFGHNEHEIDVARDMARELGMKFVPKLNAHPGFSPVKDTDHVRQKIGFSSRDEYEKSTGYLYKFPCYQVWFSPVINWDGKLLGCCLNEWESFGNVFTYGLKECIKSAKYKHLKKVILGKHALTSDMPCSECHIYPRVKDFARGAKFPGFKFMCNAAYSKLKRKGPFGI